MRVTLVERTAEARASAGPLPFLQGPEIYPNFWLSGWIPPCFLLRPCEKRLGFVFGLISSRPVPAPPVLLSRYARRPGWSGHRCCRFIPRFLRPPDLVPGRRVFWPPASPFPWPLTFLGQFLRH